MTNSPPPCILVQTSSDNADVLRRIGKHLIENRIAACVQMSGPVESQFHWKGSLETVSEWICTAKTTRSAWPRIQQAIREMHNYETPEIIAVSMVEGSADYLKWVSENVES